MKFILIQVRVTGTVFLIIAQLREHVTILNSAVVIDVLIMRLRTQIWSVVIEDTRIFIRCH